LAVLLTFLSKLYNERKEYALILARISKLFNIVATPFIYRSVTYRAYPHKDDKVTDLDLLYRLLYDHTLRGHVRSLTVKGSSRWSFKPEDYSLKLSPIIRLVSILPRLQTFMWVPERNNDLLICFVSTSEWPYI
jgi:hypothetical protein